MSATFIIIKSMCEIIASIIGVGLVFLLFIAFITIHDYLMQKKWKEWSVRGYDKAVNDITKYGWYVNKDNERIYIRKGDIPTWSMTFKNGSFIGREK